MNNYTVEFLKNGESKTVNIDAENTHDAILYATISSGLYDHTPGILKFNNGGILEEVKDQPLTDEDWNNLKSIRGYIDEGDNDAALRISKDISSRVRELIPVKSWLKMGGILKRKSIYAIGGRIRNSEYEYTYTDDNENEVELIVSYSVSPYRPATREQPEEGGYPEINSIKNKATKQEVEVPDYVYKEIEDAIYDSVEDKEYNREFAQGGTPSGATPFITDWAELWFYDPSANHDKVYNIYVKKTSSDGGDRYGVQFEFGRRGSSLKEGWKITEASLEKARDEFYRLKEEKEGKGYKVTKEDHWSLSEPKKEAPTPAPEPKFVEQEGDFEYILDGDIVEFKRKSSGLSVVGQTEYGLPVVKANRKLSPAESESLNLYPTGDAIYNPEVFANETGVADEIKKIKGETKFHDAYMLAQSRVAVSLKYYFGLLTAPRIGKLIYESVN